MGNERDPIRLTDPALEQEGGPGRSVELGRVVLLPDRGDEFRAATEIPGQLPGRTEEEVHANREIGRMQQCPSPGFYQGCDSRQSIAPSRRTSHRGDPELDKALQISDRRFWPGELDGDVHARSRSRVSARPPAFSLESTTVRMLWPCCEPRAATAVPMRPFPTIAICFLLRGLATRDSLILNMIRRTPGEAV